jgi:hypothetical protein
LLCFLLGRLLCFPSLQLALLVLEPGLEELALAFLGVSDPSSEFALRLADDLRTSGLVALISFFVHFLCGFGLLNPEGREGFDSRNMSFARLYTEAGTFSPFLFASVPTFFYHWPE